jgi:serine phosphatase RsbU (regulator of sigma subunit)
VIVDVNVTIPQDGREIITDQEVTDPDLDNRINLNRVAFADITNQNMELRNQLLHVEKELKSAQAMNYNAISTHNANLRAEKSELESRLNITQKDLERLARDVNNRQVAQIQYTVPNPALHQLKHELENLLNENHMLVN